MTVQNNPRSGRTVGLIIAFIGFLFLLDHFGFLGIGSIIGTWWPLILLLVGYRRYRDGSTTESYILLGLGALFLLANLDIIHWGSILGLWPIILIIVGLSIAFGKTSYLTKSSSEMDTDAISINAVCAGSTRHITSQSFKGGDVTAFCGGVELDLRGAKPADDCQLNVSAIMGAVEIRVPQDWRIVLTGTPILGGIEDKTAHTNADGPMVRINCSTIMGGIEIRD
jgi:predicted membrane protein